MAPVHNVEVSLGKTLNLKLLPLCHQCVYEYLN